MAKEIYVGHISENATEEDVWKLFSVMGTVTSVHLIIDPETGEFKRCGYVRMASGISLEEVVETLDGTYLVDREIVVSIARPQKPGLSKSGGNKQPWMKSGHRPGPGIRETGLGIRDSGNGKRKSGTGERVSGARPTTKTGTRPPAKPDARAEPPAEKRQAPGKGTRPASKAAPRADARAPQGKGPRTGSIPPRPRKSK